MAASLCFIIVHKLPRNIRFLLKINLNSKYQDVLYLNQGNIIQWAISVLKFALENSQTQVRRGAPVLANVSFAYFSTEN